MSADSSTEKTPTFRERVRSILIDRAALDERIKEFFDEVLDDIETVHREESRTNQTDREVTVSTTINSEPDDEDEDGYQHREITRTCFRATMKWENDGDYAWLYRNDGHLDVCHLHERDSSALCTEPHGIDCSCVSGCPACDPEPEPARWSSEWNVDKTERVIAVALWAEMFAETINLLVRTQPSPERTKAAEAPWASLMHVLSMLPLVHLDNQSRGIPPASTPEEGTR